jgi:glycogen debranching enzyme
MSLSQPKVVASNDRELPQQQTHGERLPFDGAQSDESPFYIAAPSPPAERSNRVLKEGETFAVFDHYGDIKQEGLGEKGLYHEGTRYLSAFLLKLGTIRPLFLSSTVKEENDLLTVDLTNPDLYVRDQLIVHRSTLHIFRCKFLWQGTCYEHIRLRNYGMAPLRQTIALHFEADFADIFEVRGTKRKQRGRRQESQLTADSVVLAYEGLDGVRRRTRLQLTPPPARLNDADARFDFTLAPMAEESIYVTVSCESGLEQPPLLPFESAIEAEGRMVLSSEDRGTAVLTSSEQFNRWLSRAKADLHMMTTQTPQGPYPYGGVPWYSTVFGRDGLLTAWECLWLCPEMARGVLGYLASTQAKEEIPEQDAEPGKILHETRKGEMAALGEIPFRCYYGSVDATPLFVLLAGEYYQRTGDGDFIREIWPNLELALNWIDTSGDPDQDGFIEYDRRSTHGLVHQGWKDSQDAVFHADGALATGPIALCEAQGYVYAAKLAASRLASFLGKEQKAAQLLEQARNLQQKFEDVFWCEEISSYALALDGAKRPCRVRTSNAGHCLFTGIAGKDHASRTAQTLLADNGFSGWGIRTVADGEVRYNPMSYHNGSVWPHDNALIVQGLTRYGFRNAALKVFQGLFDASIQVDLHRLPELFCGFPRRAGEGPTLYPVACSPQSWSSASVYLLLQACLGLEINGPEGTVRFTNPILPTFLQEVRISNLKVGKGSVDLLLLHHDHDVGINVLRKTGDIRVLVAI